jgi:hypothetical protein
MFRAYKCSTEFRIADDCPEHVRARALVNCVTSMQDAVRPSVPHCDREWISLVENRISGFHFPVICFIADQTIAQFVARASKLFCREPRK